MIHHFTVDVEEHFQVSAFESRVNRDRWDRLDSRVRQNMERLLGLLDEHDVRGTFFILGWIAERHPELVRELAEGGHEVASHGSDHRRVTELSPCDFRESVRSAKGTLEHAAGAQVTGYRAPSFSIVPGGEWALDILLEEGYRYDSSLFPVRRNGYGYPEGGRDPYWMERPAGRLAEIPPMTLSLGTLNIPAGGGAYFRLFPYRLVQTALRRAEGRGVPGTFYIHPWELDPEQPRMQVGWATRFRHYGGLGRTQGRLKRLLTEFAFGRIADTVERL